MKKTLLTLGLFLLLTNIGAQDLTSIVEGQNQIIYSLPMTELIFEVEVERTTQTPGPYYQYSERYLATNQVVVEAKSTFRIKDIKLKTNTVPDPDRTFAAPVAKYPVLQNISINKKGLLTGVNCPASTPEKAKRARIVADETSNGAQSQVLPLTEEYLMAGSTARLAEGAAKQIYRIRESRISLLTGDLEQMPADGASLKIMLKELDRMEKELTELFVGKFRTETIKHTIKINTKETADKKLIFRISALKGLVDINDLSGAPYYMTIQAQKINSAVNPKAKKPAAILYSLMPAEATVSLTDGVSTLISETIAMPQFGNLIPIEKSFFKQHNPTLCIDPETGRILRMGK